MDTDPSYRPHRVGGGQGEGREAGPRVLIVETPYPLTARSIADLIAGDDDIVLPTMPSYADPNREPPSLSEYVVFTILRDEDLYDAYDGRTFRDVIDDIEEAARLLGVKYAVWITEDGDGDFDLVIITNNDKMPRTVEMVKWAIDFADRFFDLSTMDGETVEAFIAEVLKFGEGG